VVSPDLEGVTGRFFDGSTETTVEAQAYDRGARRRVWELSEALAGLEAVTTTLPGREARPTSDPR
jgi:hypothetical protein